MPGATSVPSSRLWLRIAAIVLLAAVFAYNTRQHASHEDVRDSNFAKFWIAGHMVLSGQNPYDHAQWQAAHVRLGAPSTPDYIFLYPLPQAFLLAPLALLPPAPSFVVWAFLSQVLIALVIFALLRRADVPRAQRLLIPLVLFMLFFGPIYLSLQIGSIGVLPLVALLAALLLLDSGRDLLAGLLLSLLILKPSQGLTILLLIGLWLLFRRRLHAIFGMLLGGLVMLAAGLLYDPHWITEFLANSETVSARTLGIQSDVFSFASLACRQGAACTWAVGSIAALVILGAGVFFLWRNRSRWTNWEAFNIIIPLGFLAAIYLWSYDQLLYIIPVTWIVARLLHRTRSYAAVFAFLIALDLVSLIALAVQAYTKVDLLGILTTLLVLGMCTWLLRSSSPPRDAVPSPAV